jgi:FkbM family methyltransferase
VFLNPHNWLAILRAFFVIVRPIHFFIAILGRKNLTELHVKTPTGIVRVEIRNFESLRTLFSTFCRQDYLTATEPSFAIMDCGANVGIASLYFLSRNQANQVVCFEPDRENTDYLRRNLHPYADRVVIHEAALATTAGSATLFRAEDGKYSSLIKSDRALDPDEVECRKFEDALKDIVASGMPVIVKIDVEGLELDLVRSVTWENFQAVRRIISESTGCAELISRPHKRQLRAGFVEHIIFD